MIKPISGALVAASLMFAAAGSAHADATYLLDLHGTDERDYPICRVPDPKGPCDTTIYQAWTGRLKIVIDSSADGVFGDTDVTLFDLDTNTVRMDLPYTPGSVTVEDGRVTSVDIGGGFPNGNGFWHASGLVVDYYDDYDGGHEMTEYATGQLVPVPEPGSASLMLSALALAALAAGRSRRKAGVRTS